MPDFQDNEPAILKAMQGQSLPAKEKAIVKEWRSRSPAHDQLIVDFQTGAPWIVEAIRDMERIDTSDMWRKLAAGLEAQGYGPFPAYDDPGFRSLPRSRKQKLF